MDRNVQSGCEEILFSVFELLLIRYSIKKKSQYYLKGAVCRKNDQQSVIR